MNKTNNASKETHTSGLDGIQSNVYNDALKAHNIPMGKKDISDRKRNGMNTMIARASENKPITVEAIPYGSQIIEICTGVVSKQHTNAIKDNLSRAIVTALGFDYDVDLSVRELVNTRINGIKTDSIKRTKQARKKHGEGSKEFHDALFSTIFQPVIKPPSPEDKQLALDLSNVEILQLPSTNGAIAKGPDFQIPASGIRIIGTMLGLYKQFKGTAIWHQISKEIDKSVGGKLELGGCVAYAIDNEGLVDDAIANMVDQSIINDTNK